MHLIVSTLPGVQKGQIGLAGGHTDILPENGAATFRGGFLAFE